MKILTLAAAAERLGWDLPVHDHARNHGSRSTNGVLRGDLIVRGGGDPTISTRDKRNQTVFDEWAAALQAAGITTIEGRIIGDDQAFDDEGIGPGWSWDYLEAGYAAPIGALQYNENTADLRRCARRGRRRSGDRPARAGQRAHRREPRADGRAPASPAPRLDRRRAAHRSAGASRSRA